MQDKLVKLLSSIRFWIVTLTAVVAVLQGYADLGAWDLAATLDIVKIWLASVAGIGTLDSVAVKFGLALKGKK